MIGSIQRPPNSSSNIGGRRVWMSCDRDFVWGLWI